MSDMILNLDFSNAGEPNDGHTVLAGKKKHDRFVKKRRFLERRSLLHNKQNQHRQWKPPKKEPDGRPDSVKKTLDKNSLVQSLPATKYSAPKTSVSQSTTKLTLPKKGSAVDTHTSNSSTVGTNPSATRPQTSKSPVALQSQCLSKSSPEISEPVCHFGNPHKYLALDCEMVGTGPKGRMSELARCSIVSYEGDVVYDKYVLPTSPVTDFRTRWSGIQRKHLLKATPFKQARCEIVKILKGKVVVGHSIHHDFKVLHYFHPSDLTRDLTKIPLLNKKAGFPEQQIVSLKKLSLALLNQDIQTSKKGHSSVEDARASMDIYKVVEVEWEKTLALKSNLLGNQS